jgi:hypothetical protein
MPYFQSAAGSSSQQLAIVVSYILFQPMQLEPFLCFLSAQWQDAAETVTQWHQQD